MGGARRRENTGVFSGNKGKKGRKLKESVSGRGAEKAGRKAFLIDRLPFDSSKLGR